MGKAERLRDRVRSYFLCRSDHSRKVRQAVRRLHRVTWEETGSPLAAVVREQELIREHRPVCNVHGRRPENYVYVKAAQAGNGLRLYAGGRLSAAPGEAGSRNGAALALGPFRGRARVKTALELLTRCYPIRRCRSRRPPASCLYEQTETCLAPCRGPHRRVEEHDALVRRIIEWLTGSGDGPADDPVRRGEELMRRLSQQHRFEEARWVHEALDDLTGLRRSYQALREACALRFAALWPLPETAAGKRLQLDLVWDGRLRESLPLPPATAALEIGRALRALPQGAPGSPRGEEPRRGHPAESSPPALVAVASEELDVLLAVRRWLLETPEALTEPCPPAVSGADPLEMWRARLVERVTGLIGT
ncbi:MAG: hypothetical protein M1325_00390 [Actinobacteria bacterium]|nr:hypothetical protein [Actinomycetota bacterium]